MQTKEKPKASVKKVGSWLCMKQNEVHHVMPCHVMSVLHIPSIPSGSQFTRMAPFPNFQNGAVDTDASMSTRVKRYHCSTAQDAKLKAKNKDSKASGWLWSFGGKPADTKTTSLPGKFFR